MARLSTIIFAGALLAACNAASAQDLGGYPDLRGQWKGTNEAAVLGSGSHHGKAGPAEPRMTKTEFTLEITKQEGRAFSGEISSANDKEPVVGVIGSDKASFYMADFDGYSIGTITPAGQIDTCYLRSGPDLAVAACIVFSKQ